MRLLLFLSIWLFLACSLQAAPSIPNPVYVYGSEDTYDFRLNYTVAAVKAALDVDSEKLGPIEVRSTVAIDPLLTKNRAIAAGPMDPSHMFRDVKSLESLRRFRICVGRDWPDRGVLEHARIPVFTAVTMPELFDALSRGKCDALTRAVFEVRDEMLSRPSHMFTVDPYLLLKYPAQQKVFVAKTRTDLATAIELGLKSLEKNGVLAELLEVMYGDSLRQIQLDRRRVLNLENPTIFGKNVAGPYSWRSRH